MAALLGVVALVFDLGRTWNLHTELQNAVDYCALSGATQLDAGAGARQRAVDTCIDSITDMSENTQRFATDGAGAGVITFNPTLTTAADGAASNENFQFFTELATHTIATSDSEARFIEVTRQRTVDFVFANILGGVTDASPLVRAVAGWETFLCGNIPLMTCNPQEPPGNTDLKYPFSFGTPGDPDYMGGVGLTLKGAPQGATQLFSGEFVWLATVTVDEDGNVTEVKGANALRDGLANMNAGPACTGTNREAQPGNIKTAIEWLNIRLDKYPSSQSALMSDPDYQPSVHSLTGLVHNGSADCHFNVASHSDGAGNSAWNHPANEYLGPGHHAYDAGTGQFTPQIDHVGYMRDDCAYPLPGGGVPTPNCIFVPPAASGLPAGDQVGTGDWDIGAYFDFHHPGVLPAIVPDLDGDGRTSRWEVFNWEVDNMPPQMPSGGGTQCYQNPLPESPYGMEDLRKRRIVTVAVGNCEAMGSLGGGSSQKPLEFAGGDPAVFVFLTEAAGEYEPQSFYAEFVAPADDESISTAVKDRIVLYE
jgi:hypothetical protein